MALKLNAEQRRIQNIFTFIHIRRLVQKQTTQSYP